MQPLKFQPYLKSVLWGGEEIAAFKGIECDRKDIGESWEISSVPGHESVVSGGEYDGEKITALIDRFKGRLVGEKVYETYRDKLPLLIKFIDANQDLSLQVHPDDELAMKRHGSLGKTEMWYIIKTRPGAKIRTGLSEQLTPETYEKRLADNTLIDAVALYDSHPGDLFYLPAGRMHAICAGNLLVEIQETSDITYRVYDYNRRDANGNLRELHTSLAKDAIDYTVYPSYKSNYTEVDGESLLVECEHFDVRRERIDGSREIINSHDSFMALMCIDGECDIETVDSVDGDKSITAVRTGESVLIPACCKKMTVRGAATLITAAVPGGK